MGLPHQEADRRYFDGCYGIKARAWILTLCPFSENWVSGVFFWEWGDTAVRYNSISVSVWEVENTDMQSQH